jgi:MFS family permease
MKPNLGALRERDFRRLLLARCASLSGDFISLIGIPAAVFALGGSEFQIGVAFAVLFLSVAVASWVGGGLADKYPRRTVMISGDLLAFASQGTFAFLLLTGRASYEVFIVVNLVVGIGAGLSGPGINRLVSEIVEGVSRQGGNALLSIMASSATMLGPAFGGLLIEHVGVGWAFAADAATFLASALLLRGISDRATEPPPIEAEAAPHPAETSDAGSGLGLAEGFRELRGLTWMWAIVVEFAILNGLAIGPFQVFGAALGHQTLGMGNWSLILSAQGFGAVVGGIIGLFWRPTRPLLVGCSAAGLIAVPMFLLGADAPLLLITATAAVAGAGLALFETMWATTIQDHAPEDAMSRLSGIDQAGSFGLLPGGMVIAGIVLAFVGPTGGLYMTAAIVALGTATVLSVRSVRQLRAKQVAEVAA